MKRRKFLFWLKRKIFKIPEGTICPKLFRIIWYILFPFDWFYLKQSHFKYDAAYNIYTIYGNKFTGEVLNAFNSLVGKQIEVKKKDGEIIVTTKS